MAVKRSKIKMKIKIRKTIKSKMRIKIMNRIGPNLSLSLAHNHILTLNPHLNPSLGRP